MRLKAAASKAFEEGRMSRYLLVLLACLGLEIRDSIGADQPAVSAQVSSSTIEITNRSTQSVCYAIHEAHLLTLIEWAPECSADNQIAPKKSIRIKFRPKDFKPSDEAVVSWWQQGKNVVQGRIRLKAR